jgi:hypothetical protein
MIPLWKKPLPTVRMILPAIIYASSKPHKIAMIIDAFVEASLDDIMQKQYHLRLVMMMMTIMLALKQSWLK